MLKNRRGKHKYKLKIITFDGAACVSVVDSKNLYHAARKIAEPSGEISCQYKDKYYKRGQILSKLGLWTNGKNLVVKKNQR